MHDAELVQSEQPLQCIAERPEPAFRALERKLAQGAAFNPRGGVVVQHLPAHARAAEFVHLGQLRVAEPGQERELRAKRREQLGRLGVQLLEHPALPARLVLDQEHRRHAAVPEGLEHAVAMMDPVTGLEWHTPSVPRDELTELNETLWNNNKCSKCLK
jgi:hypothetical protein